MPEREQQLGRIPESLRYPKELVHRFGAKAGILMYVAQMLPDIPQAKMIVSEIGEPTEALLRRADVAGIGRPRMFRSSAFVELAGYEGDFRTLDSSVQYLDEPTMVEFVRRSTESFRDGDPTLPEEINVIIAEKSPSRLGGTYIKLPNQDDQYLVSAVDLRSSDESLRDIYDYLYSPVNGAHAIGGYRAIRRVEEKSEDVDGTYQLSHLGTTGLPICL